MTLTKFSVFCCSIFFLLFPNLKAGSNLPESFSHKGLYAPQSMELTKVSSENNTAEILYDSLDLGNAGLSEEALDYAIRGYQNLLDKGAIKNPGIITVCDFSQSSRKKRLYVIDMNNYELLMNTYVAHGKNSGSDFAKKFSNRPESHQSSLGFYVTENPYYGGHGLSLRIKGMDRGYNDRAYERAIVVHGSEYIGEQRLESNYMGRSFGCPAVPQKQVNKLINTIKDGTCIFIYHPTKSYLDGSTILNG